MLNIENNQRAKSNHIAIRKNSSLNQAALTVMQVDSEDEEPSVPEGVEQSTEAIDLPIVTTASLTMGEGLRTK